MPIRPVDPNPPDPKFAVRDHARAVNEIMEGRSNAHGEVTLEVDTEETTVYTPSVGADSHIGLTPLTANARRCGWYVSDRSPGQSFTITHDADLLDDKTFSWGVQG